MISPVCSLVEFQSFVQMVTFCAVPIQKVLCADSSGLARNWWRFGNWCCL